MNKNIIVIILLGVLYSCTLTRIEDYTKCEFCLENTKYSLTNIEWCSVNIRGDSLILIRADISCPEKEYFENWLGKDEKGNTLRFGPAIWLCIPDNIQGETIDVGDLNGDIVITKEVTIKDKDSDYSFYSFYNLASISSLSITYHKTRNGIIKCDFSGIVSVDLNNEHRTLKINKGSLCLYRFTAMDRGALSMYKTYLNWLDNKDRSQYMYWP